MTDLTPICALGAPAPRSARHGALHLRECPGVALASLAARRGAAPCGLTLPDPGHWAASGDMTVFWTGPDQWLVEAPDRAETDFAAALADLAPGWSVTEQTDGWTLIEAGGPVAALLERCVNLDPEVLAPGRAARTMIEHMPVHLLRRSDSTVAIWGMRSSAESLWHALDTIARRIAAA